MTLIFESLDFVLKIFARFN